MLAVLRLQYHYVYTRNLSSFEKHKIRFTDFQRHQWCLNNFPGTKNLRKNLELSRTSGIPDQTMHNEKQPQHIANEPFGTKSFNFITAIDYQTDTYGIIHQRLQCYQTPQSQILGCCQ